MSQAIGNALPIVLSGMFSDERGLNATEEAAPLGYNFAVGGDTAARPWRRFWIEEPQGQGRLLPRPVQHREQPAQGVKGRRHPDTLPATFQWARIVALHATLMAPSAVPF